MKKQLNINIMYRSITTPALLLLFLGAFAQSQEIKDKLTSYGIPTDLIVHSFEDENSQYSFEGTETTTTSSSTGDETKTNEFEFDPTQDDGEKWKLVKTDRSTPSSKDIKQFDKAHNDKVKELDAEVRDEDWKIIEDNEKEIQIQFRYQADDLPKKYRFLADCNGIVYVSKTEKRLTKLVFTNFQETHLSIFKVTKLNMEIDFHLQEATGEYLIEKESILMDAKLLGQTVEVAMDSVFRNYQKVN